MSTSKIDTFPGITDPKPFQIKFPKEDVDQFTRKLQDARLPSGPLYPDEPRSTHYDQETNPTLSRMKELIEGWKKMDINGFEDRLNTLPNYTTSIDWCTQLHFIHQPSTRKGAIPLMLIHGWPGSTMEFNDVVKLLAEPEDRDAQAFHVVVPAVPGFTYSTPPPRRELGKDVEIARVLNALMRGLGYERYAVQGGDWGSIAARTLASHFAHSDGTGCRACHLNFLPVIPMNKYTGALALALPEQLLLKLGSSLYGKEEHEALKKALWYKNHGLTYYDVQKNRPSQLGFMAIDSPIALLAWGAYFLNGPDWSSSAKQAAARRQGEEGVAEAYMPQGWFNISWFFENLFLYWITSSTATSFGPYHFYRFMTEYTLDPAFRIEVPTGTSQFPDEITPFPFSWRKYSNVNLQWYAQSPLGGHLASTEQPEIFARHLQAAFAPGGRNERTDDIATHHAPVYEGKGEKTFTKDSVWIQKGLWDDERIKEGR